MLGRNRCRDVSRLLWDYSAGALIDGDRERVSAHLARCPACVAEAARYSRAADLLRATREAGAPESARTWSELRMRLESEPGHVGRARPVRRPMPLAWATAAATLAVAGLLLHFAARQPGPRPNDRPTKIDRVAQSGGDTGYRQASDSQTSKQPPKPRTGNRIVRPVAPPKINYALERKRYDFGQPRSVANKLRRHPGTGSHSAEPAPAVTGAKVYFASADGAGGSHQPRKDFVLAPAGPDTDSGMQRDYVMGAIPDSQHRITTASYNGGSGEGPVW